MLLDAKDADKRDCMVIGFCEAEIGWIFCDLVDELLPRTQVWRIRDHGDSYHPTKVKIVTKAKRAANMLIPILCRMNEAYRRGLYTKKGGRK